MYSFFKNQNFLKLSTEDLNYIHILSITPNFLALYSCLNPSSQPWSGPQGPLEILYVSKQGLIKTCEEERNNQFLGSNPQ